MSDYIYYTLIYAKDEHSKKYESHFIKCHASIDIFDYLTNIYLNYIESGDAGKYNILCHKLDNLVQQNLNQEIDYPIVYKWIKKGTKDEYLWFNIFANSDTPKLVSKTEAQKLSTSLQKYKSKKKDFE